MRTKTNRRDASVADHWHPACKRLSKAIEESENTERKAEALGNYEEHLGDNRNSLRRG
jgi:hypothetical protein